MCLEAAKKYTYLSMCPCCNVVSKYANSVKTHLQRKHAHASLSTKKRVIPIRVESKWVKHICKILCMQTPYKKQEVNLKMTGEKESDGLDTADAADCKDEAQGRQVHSMEIDNIDILEKHSHCQEVKSELIDDTENTNKDKGVGSVNDEDENDTGNKVDSGAPEGYVCLYCKLHFDNLDSFQCHITEQHSEHVETVRVKQELKEIDHRIPVLSETIVVAYTCPTCSNSFQSLSDLSLHVESMHLRDSYRSCALNDVTGTNVSDQIKSLFDRNNIKKESVPRQAPDYSSDCSVDEDNVSVQGASFDRNDIKKENVPRQVPEYLSGCSPDKNSVCVEDVSIVRNNIKQENVSKQVPEYLSGCSSDKNSICVEDVSVVRNNIKQENVTKQVPEYLSCCTSDRGTLSVSLLSGQVYRVQSVMESKVTHLPSSVTGLNIPCTELSEKDLGTCDNTGEIVPGCSKDIQTHSVVTGMDTHVQVSPSNTLLTQSHHNDSINAEDSWEKRQKRKILYSLLSSGQEDCNKGQTKRKRSAKESKGKSSEKKMNEKEGHCTDVSESDACNAISTDVKEIAKDCFEYNMCYKCPFCEFFLFHRNYIESHVQIVHPEMKNFTPKDIIKYTVKMKASESKREYFKCPSCDYTTPYRDTLKLSHLSRCLSRPGNPHLINASKVNCILPDFIIDTRTRSALFFCPYCKRTVKGKKKFDTHLVEHVIAENVKVEVTLVLPEIDKSDENLAIKLECFMCTYCPFLHNERSAIRNHTRRRHKGETESPVIKCVLMDKGSSGSSCFLVHLKFLKKIQDTRSNDTDTTNLNVESTSAVSDQAAKEKESETKLEEYEWSNTMSVRHKSEMPVKLMMCPVCNYSTDSKRDASVHFIGAHPERIKTTDLFYMIPDHLIQITEKNGGLYLICNFCKAPTQNLYPLLCHMEEKHAHLPERNDDQVRPDNKRQNYLVSLRSIKASKNNASFKCAVCKNEMSDKDGLDRHMQHSHPDMTEVYDMVNHMLDVISAAPAFRVGESEQFNCGFCLEKDFNERNFHNHLYSKHPPKPDGMAHSLPSTSLYRDIEMDSSEPAKTSSSCTSPSLEEVFVAVPVLNSEEPTRTITSPSLLEGFTPQAVCEPFAVPVIDENVDKETEDNDPSAEDNDPSAEDNDPSTEDNDPSAEDNDPSAEDNDPPAEDNDPSAASSFQCNICGKSYIWEHSLRRHEKSHGPAGYKCTICDKKFFVKEYLTSHLKSHIQDAASLCSECGKSFKSARYLKHHREMKHENVFQYKCSICGKALSYSKRLKEHMGTHSESGEKLYKCPDCPKQFHSNCSLKIHIKKRSCRPKNVIDMYECSVCGKSFTHMRYLKQHQAVHGEAKFVCPLCGKSFVWKKCLSCHMKVCRVQL